MACSLWARPPASARAAGQPARSASRSRGRRNPALDSDRTLGAIVIALAVVLLMIVAAAEASVASASRARLRVMSGRGVSRADTLHRYADERASILASLSIARTLAVVFAASAAVFLIVRETERTWAMLVLVGAGAVVALGALDALPRYFVTKSPEAWGIRLLPVVGVVKFVFGPVAWMIDRSLRTLVQTTQLDPQAREAEDLLRLVEMEESSGGIEPDERQMIRGVIGLEDTSIREIMVPRIDIAALGGDAGIDEAMKLIVDRGFSRVPLYGETIDDIVGIVYAKDLLRCVAEGRRPPLREIARPPYYIPEQKRVDELLAELRMSKVHIAIVVDEYGGTAGLVTIEDLLEEIVGEIQDEYEREEAPIERINDAEAILDARVSIDALRELFGFALEDEQDFDSVGGFVYHRLGKVPVAGDEVRADGLTLRVLSVLGRRIKKVRATRVAQEEPAAQE